jgi:predicted nucleic acid-binding protein
MRPASRGGESPNLKAKLYIETTIPSYLVGRPSRDLLIAAHQEVTRDWWESRRSHFNLYVSEVVLREVRAGDAQLAARRLEFLAGVPILPLSSEALKLAEDLVTKVPIPRKAAVDAAHIAIATVYGCEYLLTWSCQHIANAQLHRAIRRVVEEYGYEAPSLCTPEELMGEQQ